MHHPHPTAARAVHPSLLAQPVANHLDRHAHGRTGRALPQLLAAGALALTILLPGAPAQAAPAELPLAAAAVTASEPSPAGPPFKKNEDFIRAAIAPAQASMRATGVPASVIIAQAALESDFGRSAIGPANNYFGIKATSKPGPAGVYTANTVEYVNGQRVVVSAKFRAYHNMEESFTDHGKFYLENPRYQKALEHRDDAREFARQVQRAGYATDPSYAAKLIRLMEQYDLLKYDQPGTPAPTSYRSEQRQLATADFVAY